MKLAVVGSRAFKNYHQLKHVIDQICTEQFSISEIISGGAKGADSLAERYVNDNQNIKLTVFHPDWTKHGRAAGVIRNTSIVKSCDILLAFWDGKSRGTKDSIAKAEQFGNKIILVMV